MEERDEEELKDKDVPPVVPLHGPLHNAVTPKSVIAAFGKSTLQAHDCASPMHIGCMLARLDWAESAGGLGMHHLHPVQRTQLDERLLFVTYPYGRN